MKLSDYTNKRRSTVIEVGADVFIPGEAKITVPKLTIGDYTRINGPITVRGQEICEIGNYCAFGYSVTIITTNHDISKPNLQLNFQRRHGFADLEISRGPIVVGHNVWIGDNATILAGSHIGDGSVVGAGAVVTGDLPPFAVAAGVPARIIKYRFSPEVIALLLDIAWWNWTEDRIARNRNFFNSDLTQRQISEIINLIVE
jgi:virginiamycin A acetyltransferase